MKDTWHASRRIGLYEGIPIPINWGAKMFGKVGNINLSALDVQTDAKGSLQSQNMFVARISQNIMEESKVGIIITNGSPSGGKTPLQELISPIIVPDLWTQIISRHLFGECKTGMRTKEVISKHGD